MRTGIDCRSDLARPWAVLAMLLVIASSVGGCEKSRPPAAKAQPYSSMPGPNDCLPHASLDGLKSRSDDQLWRILDHYTECQDDRALTLKAQDLVLRELYARGSGSAAYVLSYLYKYGSRVDRGKSIAFAHEAVRRGDVRGAEMLKDWEADK